MSFIEHNYHDLNNKLQAWWHISAPLEISHEWFSSIVALLKWCVNQDAKRPQGVPRVFHPAKRFLSHQPLGPH